MERISIFSLSCIVIAELNLVGCSNSPMRHSVVNSDMVISSATTSKMPQCRILHNEPAKIDVKFTVRVVIPNPYNPSNVARNIKYKDPIGDDNLENNDDDTDSGTDNIYNFNPTGPFHVDVTDIGKDTGKYARIRVVLRDPNFFFYDKDNIKGVGLADTGNVSHICGAEFRKNKRTAIFYVKLKQKSTSTSEKFGAYNIGIVPVSSPDTPSFIDPKIVNNG